MLCNPEVCGYWFAFRKCLLRLFAGCAEFRPMLIGMARGAILIVASFCSSFYLTWRFTGIDDYRGWIFGLINSAFVILAEGQKRTLLSRLREPGVSARTTKHENRD